MYVQLYLYQNYYNEETYIIIYIVSQIYRDERVKPRQFIVFRKPIFFFRKKKDILNLLKEIIQASNITIRFSFKRNIVTNFHASELKLKIFLQLLNNLLLPEAKRKRKVH